jgi:hypothetical protein
VLHQASSFQHLKAETMSDTSLSREPTVGEIARRLNEPLHRVEYVIRSRNIKPSALAGNCRVFGEEAVQLIEQELRRMAEVNQTRRSSGASSNG